MGQSLRNRFKNRSVAHHAPLMPTRESIFETVPKRSGGDLSKELTVSVYIGSGSGTAPLWVYDYTVEGVSNWSGWGQVTFAANSDTVTLTIQAREDEEAEGDEEFAVELGTGDGTSYLLDTASAIAVTITNVVPPGTVPALADEDKPLTANQVNVVRLYLERLGKGETLTAPQKAELEQFLTRLKRKGVEAEGETRLQQLQTLVTAMGKVAKRPAVVGEALGLYADGVENIIGSLKVGKENEYKKFKQQMNGLIGDKATERYNEIKDGFVAEWIGYHWVRYQAEMLKDKLNSMQP